MKAREGQMGKKKTKLEKILDYKDSGGDLDALLKVHKISRGGKDIFDPSKKSQREVNVIKGQSVTGSKKEGIIELVATTERPVKRWYIDWDEMEVKYYNEVLVCKEGAIETERMDSGGVKLFKNHESNKIESAYGVVSGYRVEDCALIQEVRFDMEDDEASECFRKVDGGFLNTFSVGYKIDYDKAEMKEVDGEDWLFCKSWEPLEISVVGIPADRDAVLLESRAEKNSLQSKLNSVTIKTEKPNLFTEEKNMNEEAKKAAEEAARKAELEASAKEASEKTLEKERKRQDEILALATEFEITGPDKLKELLDSEKSIQAIKLDILQEKIKEQEKKAEELKVGTGPKITANDKAADAHKTHLERELGAIMFNKKREKMEGYKNDGERHNSLHSLMRLHLDEKGIKIPNQNPELVRSVLATTDFPLALADTVHREVYSIYDSMAMADYMPLVGEYRVSDFREKTLSTTSSTKSAIKLAPESGPLAYDAVLESGEKGQVNRYVKGIKISYEMMVNDDVSLIQQVSMSLASTLSGTASALFWQEYGSGQAGESAFFRGDNLVAATPLDNAGINKAYEYLKTRRMDQGQKKSAKENLALYLSLPLNTLVVHPEMAATAKSLLRDISADTAASVNVWADEVKNLVISPYHPTKSWAAFTEPMRCPAFFQLQLTDRPMLDISSKVDFDSWCIKTRGELAIGFKALDRRGAIRFATA